MSRKNFPSCVGISTRVLNKFAPPTALGTIIGLAVKLPEIIKSANEIKKAIPAVQKMMEELNYQAQGNSEPEEVW